MSNGLQGIYEGLRIVIGNIINDLMHCWSKKEDISPIMRKRDDMRDYSHQATDANTDEIINNISILL
jgi:phosphoribulokinase